ncbi:MAG TPA: hypothetical protein VMS95_01665 [Candidatus Krumholzibacteriaceae bacterium]|jgi:hypothetical protein|nr:hypothetical protein [Candidatus Krumholzibacteriaceae bacterium]
MANEAWLDAAVFRCPSCGHFYVDASWYAVTLESDIECGVCHTSFNSRKELTDRALLKFALDKNGTIKEVTVVKHLQNKV